MLGWVASQAAAGAVLMASALLALLQGSPELVAVAGTFAAGLVALVLFSALLRIGVRRWVVRQPPDPPAGRA